MNVSIAKPRHVAVGVVVLATVAAGIVLWQQRALPDSVAYAVEGERVSADQLREESATLSALYGIEEPSEADEAADYWRDTAQASVMATLLDRAAEDEGVVISQKEVDEALAQYVAALYENAPDARDQFVRALGNAGTSQRSVEQEIRRRLTTERLIEEVVTDVEEPTQAEVTRAFTERGCSLDLPETRTLRNIVVATEAEAASVLEQLQREADFTTLAAQRSADGSSRDAGGVIGTLAASQLEEAYAQVAFATAAGAVFGPVETSSGWNVGHVTEVMPARTVEFAEVAQPFAQLLALERQSTAWRSWLNDLLADADVEYSEQYRPDDPTSIPGGVADWAKESGGVCPGGAKAAS